MRKNLFYSIFIALFSAGMFFTSCEREEIINPPLIQNVTVEGSQIGPYTVKATILDDNGALKSAELFYKKNAETAFVSLALAKGDNNTYSVEIPVQTAGDVIYYYIKAVNSVDLVTLDPGDAPATTKQIYVAGINYSGVVLNEIWAGGPTDNEKFIELFNKSNETIDISGIYFERNNEGKVGTIPVGKTLAAGAYYILGTKNNTTNPNNPNAPYDNAISSGFSAKKSVRLKMFSPTGNEINVFMRGNADNLDVNISDMAPKSFARIPNGTGTWKAVTNATLRAANDGTGAVDIPNN